MNLELSRELVTCLAIAWGCFGAGVWILSIGRAHRDLIWLGKFLVALCPGLLSLFSAHSVTVCEQVLAAKQSEAVDDRIFLASITTAEFGDGYSLTTERYSDGATSTSGRMPFAGGRGAGSDGGYKAGYDATQRDSGSLVPMSSWRGVTW